MVGFPITAFAPIGQTAMGGNMVSWIELHSNGLVTSDASGHPEPLIAQALPSLADGTVALTPDGQMTTRWTLRPDVTWQDGVPFTAADLVFGYQVQADPGMPYTDRGVTQLVQSVEALDDHTVLITWKQPYYLADAIGTGALWPLPAHLLADAYAAGDLDHFRTLPYWTSEYIHTGPFRLARYEPGTATEFTAYAGYFGGRPKVDRVVFREILDRDAAYAAVLAGDVDLSVELFDAQRAASLQAQWGASGQGAVRTAFGATFFLAFQFAPELLSPADLMDPRIRHALYLALDRPSLTGLAYGGQPTPAGEGRSLLPPTDPLYPYVQEGFAASASDPARAAAAFADAGWTRGPDGLLAAADGHHLAIDIRSTRETLAAATAGMWQQAGIQATYTVPPAAFAQDLEYMQSFSGVELTGAGDGDRILNRLYGPNSTTAANHYAGSNRGHYQDPAFDALFERYRTSLDGADRGQTMRALSDLIGTDAPLLVAFYNPIYATVSRGVDALDDFAGGHTGTPPFGPLVRHAQAWTMA